MVEEFTPAFTDFVGVPRAMRNWVDEELIKTDRLKTLVIYGPSRTGKTSWARSLGSHIYLGYAWNVKQLKMSSKYIVVDDIDLTSRFNLWQPFIGKGFVKETKKPTYLPFLLDAQKEFVMTDKYMKKTTVTNWGKPCIWLNNQDPREIPNLLPYQREYLNIRSILESLTGKELFSKFDIRWGYKNICIADEDQHKAAFKTTFGTYIP